MITPIDQNFFVIEGKNQSVGVQLYTRDVSFGSSQGYYVDGIHDHVRWGVGDNQPNVIRRLVEKNTIVRSLLESLRDMIYGSGVGFFQKTIVDGKIQLTPYLDTKLEDWSEATELTDYVISAINQRVDNANIFTRWQYDPIDDWFLLSVSDSFKTRIGHPEKKPAYHVNPYFGQIGQFHLADTEQIPVFDPRNREHNLKHTVTMSHGKEQLGGQPHYAFPSWWCSQEAIELANLITAFHKNGILNGYNIKYLIKMPQDYFDKDGNRNLDSKDVKQRWSKWGDNLSSWLSGTENVNKSMLIKYMRGSDGKMMDSIDVVPLKNLMSDDAYDKVWNNSNQAITNSVGILPTLAGVKAGSGNDSGSQIRVMADYQQHFRTPIPRHIVLKPVNQALRLMGYRDVIAAFKEVRITTLDANPTGSEAVVNQGS
ncbi:hypothetical protein GCM10027275_50300 [Rhabdobacter roseus]|uniref:Phage portal protein n=1 Tax=Rhabdobacter roseus TaxID=1655419 RepID=A0A840TZP0_9BACT|nr:hypothetical protein [Rhabdobacter roseus]MBB5287102.1 hypothetical protein [Rhabdobacter roseus]